MAARCDTCERSFPHDRALEQHFTNSSYHKYSSRFERNLPSPSALARHKTNSGRHHICGQCGSDFLYSVDLADHIEDYHWHCSACNIFVDSEGKLETHYLQSSAHHYCGPCKREFSSASNLNSHLRSTKHVGQTIKCIGCARMFPSIAAMTIHLESGTCVSGATRQKLNDTIRSQDRHHLITQRLLTYPDANGPVDTWATDAAWNGRTFECYFCSRNFRSLPALNSHLKSPVHEQKMYKCPKCAVKFTLFSGLVQHVESESCGISRFREVKDAMDRLTQGLSRMIAC